MTSIDNVTDLSPRVQYTASAAQVAFDYPFPIFEDADLTVDVDGVTKTLTTDYTVSGEGGDTGGTVTFVVAMSGGEVVTIYRDIAIARSTDIQQNGPLSSTTWNDEIDKIMLILQQLEDRIGRAIRFPLTGVITNAQAEMNPLSNFTGRFLRVSSAGLLEAAAVTDSVVTLSAEVIGALINPQSSEETAAGVTVVRYVKDYCDPERYQLNSTPGTTDMQVGWQAAIDVSNQGGPDVTFLGTHALASSVEMKSGVRIRGNGWSNSILKLSDSAAASLTSIQTSTVPAIFYTDGQNAANMQFSDFAIDGNDANNSANTYTAIALADAFDIVVENMYIHDVYGVLHRS